MATHPPSPVTRARCPTCAWFDPAETTTGTPLDDVQGLCRRDPPLLQTAVQGVWPRVRGLDWCGAWAPMPTATDTSETGSSR